MARTVKEIQDNITTVFVNEMAAIGYTVDPSTWSQVNLIRLIFYVVAVAVNILEQFFDMHKTNTDAAIKARLTPTREWYANTALDYQFGFNLLNNGDFDNAGYTDTQIAASKVIKYAAVVKQINSYGQVLLRIKLAGSNGTDLQQLPAIVVNGITEYFNRIAPAGDHLSIESNPPDRLKMSWRIYYDPLILNANGGRLDGQDSEVISNAMKQFLITGIPFSGTYVLAYHINFLEKIPGVVIAEILECSASYGDIPLTTVHTMYEPNAGWLRFSDDTDLIIQYVAQSTLQ
jgi:hypothetical protein